MCRGGIAYGDVYYESTRSLLFGPAVNAAYQLESKTAIYPRIAIDDNVAGQVITYNQALLSAAKSDEEREFLKLINGDIILQDNDGCYHLNYLCSVKQGHDFMKSEKLICQLRQLIETEIRAQQKRGKAPGAQRIIEKYQWLEKYIDASIPATNNGSVLCYCNDQ